MALKVNAYGVAANAFHDYFQMGESTTHKCCGCLMKHAQQHARNYLLFIFGKCQRLMCREFHSCIC